MYYLEDYLEKLECLPEEIKKNLMKLGEMDHNVITSMDNIRKRVDILFSKADHIDPQEFETNFQAIMSDGSKTVEESDAKIQLADQMQELMTKYIGRLDQEIHKFKMEMEADYSGITELIEKRSLDSEQSNVKYPSPKKGQLNRRLFGEKKREIYNISLHKEKSIVSSSTSNIDVTQSSQYYPNPMHTLMTLPYSLGRNKPCSTVTSQTISDAQQLPGRFSVNSSEASIETFSPEISFGSQIGTVTDVLFPELCCDELSKTEHNSQEEMGNLTMLMDGDTSITSDVDEIRYCTCNDVAYGAMVACDNKMCPYEWFHYKCVGIKTPPKGKWYCSKCKKTSTKAQKVLKSKSTSRVLE
ncbi:Zinc finger, PHD-type,Zinc finger, FYVE/PHD-type,Inhibitor of growth protein, N-terminal histone- [Cinara cedri]|uniref:Inhibitor of growth protein n=1 Tax=Cinara cedri TaxID=506608 RepID=A0A5E4M2H5_9HEMI|nr:Zinc finger, PHD-type,Zinc finger, FYVE/PHD-type,Inhibitor of growth protein, N-terminal histone- [Cinara cedri]